MTNPSPNPDHVHMIKIQYWRPVRGQHINEETNEGWDTREGMGGKRIGQYTNVGKHGLHNDSVEATVCKRNRCTIVDNRKGKNTENADKHNKGINSSIQGRRLR